jgi:hypothetical protein
MKQDTSVSILPTERIVGKIMQIRGEKIILDLHLAEFYGLETRVLKQAVRRNIERFPEDFLFELTENEINILVSQNVIPSKSNLGGAIPFAFTEPGVAMLSSVLKSKQAIDVNIAIMRTFVILRKILYNNQDLLDLKADIDKRINDHSNQILLIFEYIKQFEEFRQAESEQRNRPAIGFKKEKKV